MIRALNLGSTLFSAAFVALLALGAMSLGGRAYAGPVPAGDCGPHEETGCPNQCPQDHCRPTSTTCPCKATAQ